MEKNNILTDEELLKAMEFCIKKEECSKDCRLFNVQGCMWNMLNQSFELIHRLQNKNKLLGINLANECEEHKQFVKLAKQIDEEQKEEIKRLTEENKNLLIKVWNYERPARTPLYSSESMVHCNLFTCYNENFDLKAKNAELQKQVDELTEELDYYKCANRELTEKNAYLKQCTDQFLADYQKTQKQVDELKEERENMQAEIIATEEARLQERKDTAKKCYEILEFYAKHYYDIPLDLVASAIKEKIGVEVE